MNHPIHRTEWNTGGNFQGKTGPTSGRRFINGITIVSKPKEGYSGYWETENGRVSLRLQSRRQTGHRNVLPWLLYIDDKLVETPRVATIHEAVTANEWLIRRAL